MTDSKPTDALAAMRSAMENSIEYRTLAAGHDNNAYYVSMADRYQASAIMLAQCAQAEQLERIADALYAGTWSIADLAQASVPIRRE